MHLFLDYFSPKFFPCGLQRDGTIYRALSSTASAVAFEKVKGDK